MSAIVGTYWLDGREADGPDIRRMLSTMPHRSPDGGSSWQDGPIALGHGMLCTTPESIGETLPYTHHAGNLTITADARIDNRSELCALLRLNGTAHSIPDSQLVLLAYEKWGERCVEHLLGDFSFAIWDRTKRRLFCARDHFGIRQLYYCRSGPLFAFGTEIKALFALPGIPETINERILTEFFTHKLVDPLHTVFNGIDRLPAGHAMHISAEGFRQWKYWELTPAKIDQHLSDSEYAEEFLRLFTDAVESRVRSAYPVGAELSGGLDSSFVSCCARDLLKAQNKPPLRTISLVYDRYTECDERAYIEPVLESGGMEPHFVSAEQDGILQLMDDIYNFLDDGRASGNHHLNWLTSRGAGKAGVRILLSGQDGDSVVSHGWLRFRELAEAEKWEEFASEAEESVARLCSEQDAYALQEPFRTKREILNAYGSPVLRDWALQNRFLRLFRSVRAINAHFGVPSGSILRRLRRELLFPRAIQRMRRARRIQHQEEMLIPAELDPILAEKYEVGRRLAELKMKERSTTVRGSQKEALESPYVPATFEKLDHYAAAHGVEARHPFMDLRLVEFCLGLPSRQSFQHGWARAIMRRAMQKIVPDDVRLRAGKTFLGDPYRSLLFDDDGDRADELFTNVGCLAPPVNVSYVQDVYARRDELDEDQFRMLGRVMSLLLWKEKRSKKVTHDRVGLVEKADA